MEEPASSTRSTTPPLTPISQPQHPPLQQGSRKAWYIAGGFIIIVLLGLGAVLLLHTNSTTYHSQIATPFLSPTTAPTKLATSPAAVPAHSQTPVTDQTLNQQESTIENSMNQASSDLNTANQDTANSANDTPQY